MEEVDWLDEARQKLKRMPESAKEIRERALADLPFFAQLMNKGYLYGEIHQELFSWMMDYNLYHEVSDGTSSKHLMLPRAHLKSHMVATWSAWIIARHPEVTILYLSATANLAETQLRAIKNILASPVFRRYFPEYIHPKEGKREKWSSTELSIDHPKRADEGIRDVTIATAGLTTVTTGWHADIIVSDDIVVPENAYTEDGRAGVAKKTSQFTSIMNPGGVTMSCGTRYHPRDVYAEYKDQYFDEYNEEGDMIGKVPIWDIVEYAVEEDGLFLWPRKVRDDGKAFGFDRRTLAIIKAKYLDQTQFFAQYYNDPNDPGSDRIGRDKFQTYNPRFLRNEGGRWRYNGKRLNVYAAVDFAFSLSKKADWTAIVVIGVDSEENIYVLDIDRFKSDKTIDYFRHIAELHGKWKFNKLQAEVTVAQKVIVNDIKSYVKREGLTLSVEEYRPSKQEGCKEERIAAALEHRYDSLKMWHFEGGWTMQLEEELIQARPAHDDIKDALASAVSIIIPPRRNMSGFMKDIMGSGLKTNNRFGGVSFR